MIRRLVSTEFWTDDKVVNCFTPEDKYFMLYLLSNPHTTQLGIYKLNVRFAAFETGYSEDIVKSLIERFEKHLEIIYYSAGTGEIAIKNYLIHSIIKGGKPVADLLWKEINAVKNKELVTKVFMHIRHSDQINKTVKNIVETYLTKYNSNNISNNIFNENEIHNENENENDKSYPLSYNESCNESSDIEIKRFEEFWNNYPKHTHRAMSEIEYMNLIIKDQVKEEWLIDAAKEYAMCKQSEHDRFIKNPENWLKEKLYLDYPPGTYEKTKNKRSDTPNYQKNQFNSYKQRNYVTGELADIEQRLLQKGMIN